MEHLKISIMEQDVRQFNLLRGYALTSNPLSHGDQFNLLNLL